MGYSFLLPVSICALSLWALSGPTTQAEAISAPARPSFHLALRGGYEDDGYGGGGGGGGGGYGGGGGFRRGGGGYRGGGGGGYRGRGRGGGGYRRSEAPPDGPIDELKLYVGGLSWNVDDEALKSHFSAYGTCNAQVMKDRYTGRSRGFAFVTFEDPSCASAARDAVNGQEIDGRTVTVNNARQRVYDNAAGGGGGGGEGGGEGGME